MPGIGLAYKLPDQNAAAGFDAGARAVTQPPASPGIGMAYNNSMPADVLNDGGPQVGAPAVQPQLTAPPPLDPSQISQTAPAPAPDKPEPLVDFHKDPLSAIGLVLQSVAAGYNGTESPVDKLKAEKLAEQAQQYKTASLALDVVDKTSQFVSKLPAGQRAAAIADLDKRFSPALGGHTIAPFLTALTAGSAEKTAATVAAIKELNVSPVMMSYFSANPEAAVKFLDDYNAHKATQKTPEQIKTEAQATAEGANAAGANKPMTPAEIAANKIAAQNAATSAGSLAETKRKNAADEAVVKPLTPDQVNSALYADRAHEAEAVLSKYGSELASAKGRALDNVPAGNVAQSAKYQKASQAKTNFLMAILRKESGAAIGKDEIATGDKQYFPQFGDSQAVINQKAQNRATAIAGIQKGAGPGYKPPAPVLHYDAQGNPL